MALKAVKEESVQKLTNTDEFAKFPASALLGGLSDINAAVKTKMLEDGVSKDDPEFADKLKARTDELRKLSMELAMIKDPKVDATRVDELKEKIRGFFNVKFLESLDSLGAKVHTDVVEVAINPGSLVFDLYTSVSKPPQAPLAVAIYQNKVQKLAADMEKPEVELNEEVLAAARKPLEDEKLWSSLNVTGRIKVGSETKYLMLNTVAVGFYPKTLSAVLSLFGVGEANEKAEQS